MTVNTAPLPGPGAVRGDVAAHAARELPRDREPESRAVRDALAAAAIVQVEQFFGGLGREAAALVADVETPAAVADARGEAHAAAAIFVRVVEQVFEDHAQPVAIGQHLHGIDDGELRRRRRSTCARDARADRR